MPHLGMASSLPNLHPAIVHFPIALALTALALRTVHLIRPRWEQVEITATRLTLFAALGACAAWLAGRQAVGTLGPLPAVAEQTLSRHADLGGWTTIALWLAVMVSLVAARRQSTMSARGRVLWRGGQFLMLLTATGVLSITADLGGRLVYTHGVAVATTGSSAIQTNTKSAVPRAALAAELISDDPATNMTFDGDGIVVTAQGSGLVALPGNFDDVSVTMDVDPTAFQGRIALVHHAASSVEWEGLLLDPSGRASLVRYRAGSEEVLEKTSVLFPSEPVRLVVTAAAGHFKGYLDGELIIHGHGASGAPGRVALYFSGTGELRISSFTAETSSGELSH